MDSSFTKKDLLKPENKKIVSFISNFNPSSNNLFDELQSYITKKLPKSRPVLSDNIELDTTEDILNVLYLAYTWSKETPITTEDFFIHHPFVLPSTSKQVIDNSTVTLDILIKYESLVDLSPTELVSALSETVNYEDFNIIDTTKFLLFNSPPILSFNDDTLLFTDDGLRWNAYDKHFKRIKSYSSLLSSESFEIERITKEVITSVDPSTHFKKLLTYISSLQKQLNKTTIIDLNTLNEQKYSLPYFNEVAKFFPNLKKITTDLEFEKTIPFNISRPLKKL